MLIDAFVNAIYLYDDKLVLTFNYKDGTRTITLNDMKEAVKANTGSDLDCLGAREGTRKGAPKTVRWTRHLFGKQPVDQV